MCASPSLINSFRLSKPGPLFHPGSLAVSQHLGPDHLPLRPSLPTLAFPPFTDATPLSPPLPNISLCSALATYHPYFITIPSQRTRVTPHPNFLSLSQKLYPLSFPHSPYSLLHPFPRALVLFLYPNRNAQCGPLAARAPADRLFLPHQTLWCHTTNNRSGYRAELTAYYLTGSLNIFYGLSRQSCVYHGLCVYVCVSVYACTGKFVTRRRCKKRSSLVHAPSLNDVAICNTLLAVGTIPPTPYQAD